jgi:hypothetical protein
MSLRVFYGLGFSTHTPKRSRCGWWQLAVAALALEAMVGTPFLKPGWRHWRAPGAVLHNTRTAAALALLVRSLDKSVDWKLIATEERKRRQADGGALVGAPAAAAAGAAAGEFPGSHRELAE